MDVITIKNDQVFLDLSADEMLLLSNSLNEICNGIKVREFEIRIGDKDQAGTLLRAMSSSFDKMQEEDVRNIDW